MMEGPRLLIVSGPTASGKSALGLALARILGGGIVNADSVQVYRGLDIGSSKPSAEDRARVPHALLDTREPDEPWTAVDFVREAEAVEKTWLAAGIQPVVVGGTGLYIRALVEGLVEAPPADAELRAALQEEATTRGGAVLHERLVSLDPARAKELHPHDVVRVIRALEICLLTGKPVSAHYQAQDATRRKALTVVLGGDRAALYARIDARAEGMVEAGLLTEVRRVLESGVSPRAHGLRSIGYREAVEVLLGEAPSVGLAARIAQRTRHFARRQLTWWRGRDDVHWLDHEEVASDPSGAAARVVDAWESTA